MTDNEQCRMRLQYAGAINLLCNLSLTLGDDDEAEENRDLIMQASADWCKITGWTVERVLDRIELIPPTTSQTK